MMLSQLQMKTNAHYELQCTKEHLISPLTSIRSLLMCLKNALSAFVLQLQGVTMIRAQTQIFELCSSKWLPLDTSEHTSAVPVTAQAR